MREQYEANPWGWDAAGKRSELRTTMRDSYSCAAATAQSKLSRTSDSARTTRTTRAALLYTFGSDRSLSPSRARG